MSSSICPHCQSLIDELSEKCPTCQGSVRWQDGHPIPDKGNPKIASIFAIFFALAIPGLCALFCGSLVFEILV